MTISPCNVFEVSAVRLVRFLVVLGLAASGCNSTAPAQVSVFRGAVLIDGTGAPALPDAVLVVQGGRVECSGNEATCAIPEGARVVDLAGRWITPGLIDSHVHFAQTGWADGRPDGIDVTADYPYPAVVARQHNEAGATFRSYLCSGVTGVFDVGGFPWSWSLREGRELVEAADYRLPPPHVAAAGPLLTWVPPRMDLPAESVMIQVTSPEQGREVVRYLAAFDSDAVKVWFLGLPENPRPDAPERQAVDAWVTAVGEEASRLGLPLIVHATSLREAKVAIQAGAHLLVHSVSDQAVDEEFLTLALQQGTIYTPTLLVSENWWAMSESVFTGQAPVLDDPNGCVDPATRKKIASTPRLRELTGSGWLTQERVDVRRQSLQKSRATMAENLRRIHEAGIVIAMGTDAGNPLTVHGPSVCAEMERMEEAGLKPGDILVSATRNAARAMGREAEIGTLEKGKWADFLVLAENPLEHVKAFRSLTHVARAGQLAPVKGISFDEK